MSEVGAGVTDLVLGTALVGCAARLQWTPGMHRYWALIWWSAGAAAFAGAAHHLVFSHSPRAADLSWVAVGVLVAVALSYLLAATATATLDERWAGWSSGSGSPACSRTRPGWGSSASAGPRRWCSARA
jgi:hypothetical protein